MKPYESTSPVGYCLHFCTLKRTKEARKGYDSGSISLERHLDKVSCGITREKFFETYLEQHRIVCYPKADTERAIQAGRWDPYYLYNGFAVIRSRSFRKQNKEMMVESLRIEASELGFDAAEINYSDFILLMTPIYYMRSLNDRSAEAMNEMGLALDYLDSLQKQGVSDEEIEAETKRIIPPIHQKLLSLHQESNSREDFFQGVYKWNQKQKSKEFDQMVQTAETPSDYVEPPFFKTFDKAFREAEEAAKTNPGVKVWRL